MLKGAFWLSLALVSWQGCMAPPPAGPQGASAEDGGRDTPSKVDMERADGDICGFSEPVSLGPADEDGLVDVPANHPAIFYMGRIDCSDPLAPTFAYPGVSIRVRFEGDALDMKLEDFGDGTPSGTNYYGISIDGAPAKALQVSPTERVYTLARGLADGEHSAEVFKRVESNHGSGKARFHGFRIRQGRQLLPSAARARRLEFIGDSITCGYGNELSTADPTNDHYTTKNSNAQAAYGALVARALDAEYVAVAASGRGVSRNYGGEPGTLVPELFTRALPDETTPWDTARYQPDATVINLGTNDYSTPGVDRAAFRTRYRQFLGDLRSHYPTTTLVVCVGPMLSDDYPPGERVLSKIREDVHTVLEELKAKGEQRLYYVEFAPQSPPFGEDWHPSLATHQRMAEVLTAKLQTWLHW